MIKEFRLVEKESYYSKNPKTSDDLVYPYLTYTLGSENLNRGVDGFYLDVDIIDSNSSYINLLTLEQKLKDHFIDKNILLDGLFIRFNFIRSNEIDMLDELIKRRSLQFYCKVYWRDR